MVLVILNGFDVALDSVPVKLITPQAIRGPAFLKDRISKSKFEIQFEKYLLPSCVTVGKSTFATIISEGM